MLWAIAVFVIIFLVVWLQEVLESRNSKHLYDFFEPHRNKRDKKD